jgi:hypothetical protein
MKKGLAEMIKTSILEYARAMQATYGDNSRCTWLTVKELLDLLEVHAEEVVVVVPEEREITYTPGEYVNAS